MANSDNVLRCGLTPKHVDVPELLRIVRFDAGGPGVLRPAPVEDGSGEELYATPVDDFRLSRHVLAEGSAERPLPAPAAQILLCTAGRVALRSADGRELALAPGRSAYVPAGEQVTMAGAGTLFRATVAV